MVKQVLKQITGALILIFALQPAVFAGPIIVGNGNGEAEFNVLTAQRNITEVLAQCFTLSTCAGSLDSVTKVQVQEAVVALKELHIVFDSNSALGGKAYQVNSESLILNRDLLYLKEQDRGLNYEEAVAYLVQVYVHARNSTALANEFLIQLKQTAQEMSRFIEFSVLDAQKLKLLFFASGQLSISLMDRADLLDQQALVLKDLVSCKAISGQDTRPEAASIDSLGFYYHVDVLPLQFEILSLESVVRCQDMSNELRDYKVWLTLDIVIDRTSLKFQKDPAPHSEVLRVEAK
jgi:hypothetical protein